MTLKTSFSDFQIGDLAIFEQSFEPDAFTQFAAMSGDLNPLHHDADYAAASEFARPIVPMHMTISPLSRIAGMIFPGNPSLYLGHEVRSILPVFYGDRLTYSAKITGLNAALQTLTIRVLVCRDVQVVLEAQMRVKSRLPEWTTSHTMPDLAPAAGAALVTGAAGEIGTALTMALARRGVDLVLVDRGPGPKRDALAKNLERVTGKTQKIAFTTADLNDPASITTLCETLADHKSVTSVFHSASPPIDAPLHDLVQVNYSALQQISQAVLTGMLMRQRGVVATIGSVATERVIAGWHHYSAAKAMAAQCLTAFDKSHSEFGVRGLTVLSGLVATEYSKSLQGSASAMLPQELAEAVVSAALDDQAGGAIMIEWNGTRAGATGFYDNRPAPLPPTHDTALTTQAAAPQANGAPKTAAQAVLDAQIESVVRRSLRLADDVSLAGGGVGTTPGWDSLRHIELILELEGLFGIHFGAGDVDKMLSFEALVETTKACLAQS